MTTDRPLVLLLGITVGVLAVARAVRLVVDDDYPPIVTLREWWTEWSARKGLAEWTPLVECPFCAAPYIALPATLWFASLVAWERSTWNLWLWWIVNGWAAASYVASMIVVRDVPKDDRE